MRRMLPLFLLLAISGQCQPSASRGASHRAEPRFAGRWWLGAEPEERSGFIDGVADCLTWMAHEKGFSATPAQLADKITKFYKGHTERADVLVVDAWTQIMVSASRPSASSSVGESWSNPHWYLNGDWWGSISPAEEKGYVEGYLWCANNRVKPKTETYSKAVGFYQEKINAYIKTHPKSGSESIAAILHRYRDPDATAKPRQALP